ncbi:helix-turn-helix domain-containing protein [Thauera mechernichensis]
MPSAAENLEALFPGKPLLTPLEVAEFLQYKRKKVYALTSKGWFPSPLVEKIGGSYFFRKNLLADFVEGRLPADARHGCGAQKSISNNADVTPVKRRPGRPRKSGVSQFLTDPSVAFILAACHKPKGSYEGGPRGYWTRRGKIIRPVTGSAKAIERAIRSGLKIAVAYPSQAVVAVWANELMKKRETLLVLGENAEELTQVGKSQSPTSEMQDS